MTSDGTKTYVWDAENRLVSVSQGGTMLASFTYNKDSIRKAALGCGAVLGGVPHFLPMGR